MLALLADASTTTIRSSSIPSARPSRGRTRRRQQRGCAGGTRAPRVGIRGGGRSNVTKTATTMAAAREGSGGEGGKGASRGSCCGGRSRREGRTGEAGRTPLRIRSGGLGHHQGGLDAATAAWTSRARSPPRRPRRRGRGLGVADSRSRSPPRRPRRSNRGFGHRQGGLDAATAAWTSRARSPPRRKPR